MISGVPATGKSTYGRWLQRHHGFVHVDIENGGFDRVGLADEWADVCHLPPPPVDDLLAGLRTLGAPVALEWGFPPECLPIVKAMNEAGISAWWFDGNRDMARAKFMARATVSVEALDAQMAKIELAWDALRSFYVSRIIDTLNGAGSFVDWSHVFELMFSS
jgi:hypothetical protein